MNKESFLLKLDKALNALSSNEREKVLRYYDEYITDAGIENENAVLQSLGSPEDVAKEILSDYRDNEKRHNRQTREFMGLTKFTSILSDMLDASLSIEIGNEFALQMPDNTEDSPTEFSYEIRDDTLYINEESVHGMHWLSGFFKHSFTKANQRVVITLPEQTYRKFSIENVNGKISISGVSVDTVHAETTNGAIQLTSVHAKNIHLEAVNGGISATSVDSSEMHAECVNGSVTIGGELTGKTHAECVNGTINVETTESECECDWKLESVCGGVYVNGNKIKGSVHKRTNAKTFIHCESVNGSIRLKTN